YWTVWEKEVDDILYRSNRHNCELGFCNNNKQRVCRARFPRELRPQTILHDDGRIESKHEEEMMNTFSYLLTYIIRCNTDVTHLLSGTLIHAVIAYITDYISKSPLKMYGTLESVKTVFSRNAELIIGDKTQQEKAR
ncbi:hypothetical protein M422DRAFT_83428, partial [Sphaerobolus stellatus SS14]